jgi:hypothetical protein
MASHYPAAVRRPVKRVCAGSRKWPTVEVRHVPQVIGPRLIGPERTAAGQVI